MRVCTHTRLLSALSLSPYLWIQRGKALLQLLYLYFSTLVRQLRLACLLHCSVSTVPSCLLSTCFVSTSMLYWHCAVTVNIGWGKGLCHVFNVKRIFHQISPMYMQIPTTIFWSGNWFLVHNLQISLLAWRAFICLRSSGYSGALQSWLCKVMVKKYHNHLLITIYFSSPFFLAGWFEHQYWRWIQVFLWRFQPIWEPRKHGHYLFHQSVFLWKAGGGESGGREQTPGCKVLSGCCFVSSSICILHISQGKIYPMLVVREMDAIDYYFWDTQYKIAPACKMALSQDFIKDPVVFAIVSLNLSFWRHVNM